MDNNTTVPPWSAINYTIRPGEREQQQGKGAVIKTSEGGLGNEAINSMYPKVVCGWNMQEAGIIHYNYLWLGHIWLLTNSMGKLIYTLR